MNPTISHYANATAIHGTQTTLTDFMAGIRTGTSATRIAAVRAAGDTEAVKALKKALPCVTFAGTFTQRKNAALVAHSGLICADLDTLGERAVSVRAQLANDPRTVALFTSPSGDGLKAVFRCDPARPHLHAFHAARAHVQTLTGEAIDDACKDVARLCFVSHDADAFLAADVSAIPLLDYPASVPEVQAAGGMEGFDDDPVLLTPEIEIKARAYLAKLPPAINGQGGSEVTFKVALALAWGFGLADADAMPLFREYSDRCSPPWTDDELLHKLDGARADTDGKPPFKFLLATCAPTPGEPMAAGGFNTDVDASLRFAAEHADALRYVPGVGWLFWDGTRWAEDRVGRAVEMSKQSARKWVQQAASANADHDVKKRMVQAALNLEQGGRINAAVSLAKSDPRLVLDAAYLDADPYAINLRNGTLDLRTGELHPHRREAFHARRAEVDFVPGATHPALTRYLNHLNAAEPGFSTFLARCFGAALTGDAATETLFLLQGEGGSGKTTLVEAVSAMLGDYSVKLAFDSFVLSKHGRGPGAATPDLVKLRGSRLAYASEGDQSARLDAGTVKTLTGNEPITVRGLYKDPLTIAQTWKLWLVSNFDPHADADDSGIWRRMAKLVFRVIPVAQRDPGIKRALTTDPQARSALLAWALAGCRDWQARGGGRAGLALPASVQAATDAYRQKQNLLADWWADLLASADAELKPNEDAAAATLRGHYDNWTRTNGARAVGKDKFADFLREKGLTDTRAKGARVWRGLAMTWGNYRKTPPGFESFAP